MLRRLRRFAVGCGQACDASVFCGGVCVFAVFAFVGRRPFFAAFCGWRRAGVRCGRFFAAVFVFGGGRAGGFDLFAAFLRFLRLAAGGQFFCFLLTVFAFGASARFFAVFAFGGGWAIFRRFRLAVSVRAMRTFFRRFCVFFALGGRLFIFCDVCVGISGVPLAHFAVFAFCGGRAAFHNSKSQH